MIPSKLKNGDLIGVVTTSAPILEERKIDLENSINFFNSIGLNVKIGEYVSDNELGYGTTAKKKAEEINKMFADSNIKAIFCCCGGNNVNGVFDYLDFEIIKNNPKILCGYSDPTSLLNVIYEKTGLVTFLGPNFTSFSEEFDGQKKYVKEETIKRFLNAELLLGTKEDKYETIKDGFAEGILVGGNLSLISRFSAGKYSMDFSNKILIIEELSYETPPEGVSSYLYYMKQNGVFDKIKGLWIGNYDGEVDLEKIVLDTIGDEYAFPIIKSNNFGHIDNKTVIPIGTKARIDTKAEKKIVLLENCLN